MTLHVKYLMYVIKKNMKLNKRICRAVQNDDKKKKKEAVSSLIFYRAVMKFYYANFKHLRNFRWLGRGKEIQPLRRNVVNGRSPKQTDIWLAGNKDDENDKYNSVNSLKNHFAKIFDWSPLIQYILTFVSLSFEIVTTQDWRHNHN